MQEAEERWDGRWWRWVGGEVGGGGGRGTLGKGRVVHMIEINA